MAIFLVSGFTARAQELEPQKSRYSAYLDLRPTPSGSESQTVPAWIEASEFMPGKPEAASATELPPRPATRPVFRIRLQRPAQAADDLQVRVFFQDRIDQPPPRVTAWDELGTELLRSKPLGQQLGLASSESLTVPMTGVNYLEIETTGDGSQIRGVFFSWLEQTSIRQSIDFPSAQKVAEPFRIIPAKRVHANDASLYGVVTASLRKTPMRLNAETPSAVIQFDLERQPLIAVVSYQVLAVNAADPPVLRANSRVVGPLDLSLPDLADPGYQGLAQPADGGMDFHYTGWIQARKVIPGRLLLAGLNELSLELSNGGEPLAIRAVEIQLKYNWDKFDYVLPAPPANSPP